MRQLVKPKASPRTRAQLKTRPLCLRAERARRASWLMRRVNVWLSDFMASNLSWGWDVAAICKRL